ncbi:D-alanyl-D-alanine carboxypeptidase [Streptomyces sp. DG2A-72]|uniref:D-alanyl-D-alanine carboxypeptidase n=1 Tax=Streptomyces sp. DG2A-72 TaxID=3051386 RepID=UPI00265C3416|nr:D-alanyl-D-alanine carboxypeptidase [Streptomyces sp. DG2A-72]MDO0933925.1 D-alanyl-D-alanine carboxypeptidase [Streptomyces sp. DG2A-72]
MEEASVAGESPDRSKQRESSAEPTSGSAGPVPEARSEAADPRLAVARDAGSSSSSEARGGVDTATKVFSVRDLPKDVREADGASGGGEGDGAADSAGPEGSSGGGEADVAGGGGDGGGAKGAAGPEGSSGGGEADVAGGGGDGGGGPEGAAGPEDISGGGEANAAGDDDANAAGGEAKAAGDDRLRAAVAAWVDVADEEPSEGDAEAEAEGAVTSGDVDGGAEGGDEAAGEAEAAAEADAEPEGDVDAEAGADAETGVASQGDADADGDAEAADAGTEADSEAGADSGADSELEGDADAGSDAEAEADSDAGADSVAGSKSKSESESEPEADVEPEAKADSEAGAEPEADAEPGAKADSEAGAEPEGDVDAEAGADSEGDADADADADAEAGAGREAKADSEADVEPEGDADDGEAVADAEAKSEPEAHAEPDAGSDVDDDTDADDSPKADKPPVDQPTAAFKAVRPSAPAVDQPTTMLKLGGVAKPEPKDADKPDQPDEGQSRKPVADVERTSRFVALKPLDEPRPAAPDVTSAVPQVGPERTTQQPLPPKPPLDLLAELTNTPPPPQTPLRTAARRVKIWTPLVLLLAIVFAVVQAVRPLPTPELTLTAEDSYTFEGSKVDLPWPGEGQGWTDVNGIGTMGSFGEQKPVAIGSVAKAMTAYIVLKDHPLKSGDEGPKIKVDALAEKEGGYNQDGESTLNTVKEGDTLTLKQALSAIMIPSANNIARLLARWDAGSEKAFIEKMNDAAKELGMKNTTYTDASGLKESTVSTAEDQVKLGNELVEMQALVDITKLPYWDDPSGQRWNNYNKLVPYNDAIGIKTGTTTKAGGNLLYAATKEVDGETVTVVGAILGQHTAPIIDTVNAVSKTAMLAAQDAITSEKILKKGDVVGYVDDQLGGQTPIVVTKDVSAVGWAGLKVKVSFASDEVPHTAKAGTRVGTLTVGDGSGGAVEVPVALQTDLAEPGFTDKLTRLA